MVELLSEAPPTIFRFWFLAVLTPTGIYWGGGIYTFWKVLALEPLVWEKGALPWVDFRSLEGLPWFKGSVFWVMFLFPSLLSEGEN
jgi:hypothetical protein